MLGTLTSHQDPVIFLMQLILLLAYLFIDINGDLHSTYAGQVIITGIKSLNGIDIITINYVIDTRAKV